MNPIASASSGLTGARTVTVNTNPPSLLTLTGAYLAVTVPGAKPGQQVFVNPTADLLAGYTIGDAYVSALNTVRVQFINSTAGTLDPAAQDMNYALLGT